MAGPMRELDWADIGANHFKVKTSCDSHENDGIVLECKIV